LDGVLKGFFVVGAVMLVGYILGKTNALGPHGTKVLSTLTFLVGLPSLMFSLIASRHISDVLGAPTTVAVILKSAVQPALAWVLAVFVFRLDAFSTFVVTACAILPTGQNVVLYAVRYRVGQSLAQSTAVITSVLAVPLLLGAA
jgi:predicted permease